MEYEAKVVLAKKVWEQIDWFTRNFTTEIGALGIVKIKEYDGEKNFYVEELLFPKQKVSGASVNFTPEGWGELVKERGLKGLENISFYWHRHPGSASHSSTDETHTFGGFMDSYEDGKNRPYFIFYQTAISSQGFNEEARIELRKPIRATLMNINVTIDDPEDKKISEECKKITEKCIIKEPIITYSKSEDGWFNKNFKQPDYSRTYGAQKVLPLYDNVVLNGNVEPNHFNNDIFKGIPTTEEDKVSVTYENGQVTILAGTVFDSVLTAVLNDKNHELTKCVSRQKSEPTKTGIMIKWNLQPGTGSYQKLRETTTKLYTDYLKALNNSYEREGVFSQFFGTNEKTVSVNSFDTKVENATDMEDCYTIYGWQDIADTIRELEEIYNINWIVPGVEAEIFEFEEMNPLGKINIDRKNQEAIITGEEILSILMGDYEDEEDIISSKLEEKVSNRGKKNDGKK